MGGMGFEDSMEVEMTATSRGTCGMGEWGLQELAPERLWSSISWLHCMVVSSWWLAGLKFCITIVSSIHRKSELGSSAACDSCTKKPKFVMGECHWTEGLGRCTCLHIFPVSSLAWGGRAPMPRENVRATQLALSYERRRDAPAMAADQKFPRPVMSYRRGAFEICFCT